MLGDLPAKVRRRALAAGVRWRWQRRHPGRLVRLGSDYGGYIVPEDLISADSICYSGGVGLDASFDLALIERFGCHVHAFDPTPRVVEFARSVEAAEPRFHFIPVGVWSEDRSIAMYVPRDPAHISHSILNLQGTEETVTAMVRSLASLGAGLGHDRIDLLKLDIEGSEHEVIDWLVDHPDMRPAVLCLEIDQPVSLKRLRRTLSAIRGMTYTLVASERWNLTFVRRPDRGEWAENSTDLDARPLRRAARHIALDVLATGSLVTGDRGALRTPRVQHLFLHHVFPDEEAPFVAHVEALSRDHTIISYSDAIERVWTGDIDAPYVALSFDDGLRSCVRAGELLSERGVSACFFVVGAMVGQNDPAVVGKFCRQRLSMPPTDFLTWDDCEHLVELGHEIGSHTMTHARLADLDSQGLADEIDASHELLQRRLGSARHFAWPYGHYADAFPGVVERVRAAGFDSCAANERGAHASAADPATLCVRRDHLLARWPQRHVRWFLTRNSKRLGAEPSTFPASAGLH
jgi:FkbM family methyltransferase